MKHTLIKSIFGVLLFILASMNSTLAQNGLENVIVEKYYLSNSADSTSAAGNLPVGSVTYRIYVDMKAGYNFQALYGVAAHPLTIQTTTSFFNDENYGSTSPNGISTTNVKKFTAMIDSWFSVGAGCAGKVAVRKSVDTDGTLGNTNGILANNDPSITYPITGATGRDGLLTGSPVGVTFVGITNTGNGDLGVFDGTSQVGGLFTTNNGSIAALGGATGLDTVNVVCVGQFTTTGALHYELNIQIGTPTGGTENYVFSNPTGSEITRSFLTGTVGAANVLPTVSISSPASGASFITGSTVTINATAADADGTVSSVEFFVDGVSIGVDNTSPYSANYTGITGTHSLTARATDNNGGQTTSAAVSITVASNPPPTCSITAPTTGTSYIVSSTVSIAATATDNGSVASVEFFVDGTLLSTDNTAPYTASYTAALGTHSLTARATDNLGAQTTSSVVSISVVNNVPPTVSLTAPANNANFTFPATVTFSASAADSDGSIASVGFYVNGSLVGTDNTAPYSFAWTSVIGTATVTARATDNFGAVTTSSAITVNILDPNALPYKVITTNAPCASSTFCVPVRAIDTVRNVIGYDVTLSFNTAKIRPTGNVTVYGNLTTASYVDQANSIDTVNGTMVIALSFNATAPATARFSGIGDVFCVEFNKLGTVNSTDTTPISISNLQESYITGVASKLVEAGKYISYKDTLYRGNVRFWIDNTPIKYNVANPNQYLATNIVGVSDSCTTPSGAIQPDTLGAFNFVITNGTKLKISKDILATTSVQPVVNGFDAFLIRRLLLNDPTFVPSVYQVLAADVNQDGVISAGDLSQSNQRAVLFIPEFRQAWNYNAAGVSNGQPSRDWIFVDSATTLRTNLAYRISANFPGDDGIGFSKWRVPVAPTCLPTNVANATTCPTITPEVYKAILLGDVNGSYSTTASNGAFRMSGTDRVVFDASKAVISNNRVEVPVAFYSEEATHAVDFSMNFNEQHIRFESVQSVDAEIQALAYLNSDDRTLRFTSSAVQPMNPFGTMATLRFEVLNGKFDASDLTVIEGYLNGDRVRIEKTAGNGFNLAVFPNPADQQLNIIPSETADIVLYDISGRVVFSHEQAGAGQRLTVNISEFTSGVYTLRVSNDQSVSTQRVVINR